VLDLDDDVQRTPRSDPSPWSTRGDSDLGTDDMSEQILLHRLETLSVAETTSTGYGTGIKGYVAAMNQLNNRSIAPSSHDGSFAGSYSPSTTYMDTAYAQPIPVATGKPSPLRHEIRGDSQLERYSPKFPTSYSPSNLSNAPNSQYSSDTIPNIPSYSHQQSQQSPPLASGGGSFRSSSSSTVRPPVRSPQDSPSANSGVPSPRPSPSATSSSSSDSAGSHSSTRSVAGGHLALFNQMVIQKKETVEWKIASSGPPHKPKFDAQVLGKFRHLTYARLHALTDQLAQFTVIVTGGVKP